METSHFAGLPLMDWYTNAPEHANILKSSLYREICQRTSPQLLPLAWAMFNTELEKQYAPDAIEFISNGGHFLDWCNMHTFTADMDELLQEEQRTIVNNLNKKTFVHIGCGSLPTSGLYYAQMFERVVLVDMDHEAIDNAKAVIHASGTSNIETELMNGKDMDIPSNSIVLIASMVMDKHAVIQNLKHQGINDILVRTTDNRPRSIFYEKPHGFERVQGYSCQGVTNPPATVDNLTLHFQRSIN